MLLPFIEDSLPAVLSALALALGIVAVLMILFGMIADGKGLASGLLLGAVAIHFHQVATNDPTLDLQQDVNYVVPILAAILATTNEFAPGVARIAAYLGCAALSPFWWPLLAVVGAAGVDYATYRQRDGLSAWASPSYGIAVAAISIWQVLPDCSNDTCVGGNAQRAVLNLGVIAVFVFVGLSRMRRLSAAY